jgi:hypothetical protein
VFLVLVGFGLEGFCTLMCPNMLHRDSSNSPTQ